MQPVQRIPSPSLKDEQIVDSILNGKKDDYELIMRRYNERLYRIGISILKNDSDVEDAMQEAYIRAYHQLKNFRRQSTFSTWLCRILINECLAKLKQRKKFEKYPTIEQELTPLLPAQAVNNETPEKQLLQKELNTIIANAIQSLPQKYKIVFMMREVERMSVQETATCLKITSHNVKVRLHRAKNLLQANLKMMTPEMEFFSFRQTKCNRIVWAVLQKI